MDPLGDGKSRIELIDSMGNDLSVVNDARASFAKRSEVLAEKDIKLIKYLIQHKHTSPLRGVTFKFQVKAPLFLCRQWWKHVVASAHNEEQLGWNEKSFRYTEISDEDEFYIPKQFHHQSSNNKQAAGDPLNPALNNMAIDLYRTQCEESYQAYKLLLGLGVCREEARGVLVPAVYTNWVWTASLQSTLHFVGLRKGEGAQKGIQLYAAAIEELISPIVPHTIGAWKELNYTI